MTCANCGQEATEIFCAHCGQRTNVKRITFKEGWFDFWSRIYGFDGMFPRTLRDITIRPGKVARDYINGNRVKYYGPVGYFFLMITFYLLLLSLLNINISDLIQENQNRFSASAKSPVTTMITGIVSEYIKILYFTIVFFQALAARYFFFRKSGLNLLEQMVLPFYIVGHGYWLSMIWAVVYKFTNLVEANVIGGVVLLYFGFAYTTFIDYQSKLKSFFKGIGVFLGGYVLLIVFISIFVTVVIILLAYFNPDALESFKPSNNR